MERDSFVFYRSFYEAIKDLQKDIKLEVLTAIIEYALFGRQPENLKPFARGMFVLIKPNIDVNNARFENGKKGAQYGKHGGRPRKSDPADDAEPDNGAEPAESDNSAEADKADDIEPPKPSPKQTAFLLLSIDERIDLLRRPGPWRDEVLSHFRLLPANWDSLLEEFRSHCVRENKRHNCETDLQSHFNRWLARHIQPSPNETDSRRNQTNGGSKICPAPGHGVLRRPNTDA